MPAGKGIMTLRIVPIRCICNQSTGEYSVFTGYYIRKLFDGAKEITNKRGFALGVKRNRAMMQDKKLKVRVV